MAPLRKAALNGDLDMGAAQHEQPPASTVSATGALALLFAINLLNYIDRYALPGVLPLVEKAFPGISKERLGWLAPAFLIVYTLTSPVFGLLGDRHPRKIIIAIGVKLWSLATAGAGLARSFWQLFFSRALVGVGEAAYGTTAPTVIADLFPPARRGRALAIFYVAIPVGSALGYLLGGLIGTRISWRAAFFVVGLPGVLLGLAAYGLREPVRGAAEEIDENELKSYLARRPRARDYLGLLRVKSYLINTLGMTAYTYVLGGISYWMPTYLNQQRRLRLDVATFRFGLITVTTGIGGTLGGSFIADRLARRWRGAYFLVCGASMLAAFPAFVMALRSERPTVYWSCLAIAELLLFLNTGPSNTIIANVSAPAVRTSAYALNILCIHTLGDVLSPVIMGAIADRSDLGTAFLSTAGVVVASGLLWLSGTPFLAADSERVKTAMRQ